MDHATARKLKKVRSGPESLMEKARQIHGGTQGAVVHEDEVLWLIKRIIKRRVTDGKVSYYVQ